MPYRISPLVTGEIYHVFNRSIAKQPIFITQRDYQRALETINFYRYQNQPMRFSYFKRLPSERTKEFLNNLAKNGKQSIEILAFCIMPNHVHFLLKQLTDNAISTFMNNFQHSYSKYFNTKNERTGALFQSMYKAVRIETEEQFLHVSRYIHLNPVTSFIIKIEHLINYPWSSFKDYINHMDNNLSMVNNSQILSYFKTKGKYKEFVFDQADYQRKLNEIKHLSLE